MTKQRLDRANVGSSLEQMGGEAVAQRVDGHRLAKLRVRPKATKGPCKLHGRGTAAMMIGYARVSTEEQNLALQLDARRGAGCEEILQDTGSGADDSRKGLAAALERCAAGDVLVVWKLDRLGRSLAALVASWKLYGAGRPS